MDHSEWCFLQRVVGNIKDQGLRTLNRGQIKSPLVAQFLVQRIGFKVQGDRLVFPPHAMLSKTIVNEIQKGADTTLDPDNISFAQVAEILGRDGTLPGIDLELDETPLGEWGNVTEMDAPKKPWEIT